MKVVLLSLFLITSTHARWGEIKTIDVEHSNSGLEKSWHHGKRSDEEAITTLFQYLSKSETGKGLITKLAKLAKSKGVKVSSLVDVGETSLTDTTLVRRFDASNPHKMRFETKSKVYVNKNLSLRDAILDLAHELTHLTMRKAFNPYEENYNLKKFVKGTIEGVGGEVEAYMVECQVAYELFGSKHRGKCSEIVDPKTGRLSFSKGKKHFYKVGDFFGDFYNSIKNYGLEKKDFVYMSSSDATFISSAYGIPYPIAAVKEYEVIMEKVCSNDKRRLSYMKQSRSVASTRQYEAFEDSLHKRCHRFL